MTATAPAAPASSVGDLLRDWRQRRRLSQLALAGAAGISARHLSFLETGRARPSRGMLLRLAERLEVPLREQNLLLAAAGFAARFPERRLDDPAMAGARRAVERLLAAHAPFPALAIDRHWRLLAHNEAVPPLLAGAAAHLLAPPVNVLRLSLHPEGLAPMIENLAEWRAHLLERLRRQIEATVDATLLALFEELRRLPEPAPGRPYREQHAGLLVPLRLRSPLGTLSLLSTTTLFGTPQEVTLAELAIESFFPADAATAEALRRLAGEAASS